MLPRQPALPLVGLYRHLLRHGFALSVRDLEDALAALRLGYGLHRRDELRWLCETLWARSEVERMQLERLFRSFPWPSPDEVRKLGGGDRGAPALAPGSSGQATAGGGRQHSPATAAAPAAAPAIDFAPPGDPGVGLPRAQSTHSGSGEGGNDAFIFTPRPLLALRTLIIAWRRFRLTRRSGPAVELDVEATIAAQCRHGHLLAPALLPARRNQARLTVLVDSSPSMIAWRSLHRVLAESLAASRLALAALYFFDNVPEAAPEEEAAAQAQAATLYEDEERTRPVPLAKALADCRQSALLIISDAGCARSAGGRPIARSRVAETRRFLETVGSEWQPIAWLNPMPRARWRATTAQRIADLRGSLAGVSTLSGFAMFALSENGLLDAIDFLRGQRAG